MIETLVLIEALLLSTRPESHCSEASVCQQHMARVQSAHGQPVLPLHGCVRTHSDRAVAAAPRPSSGTSLLISCLNRSSASMQQDGFLPPHGRYEQGSRRRQQSRAALIFKTFKTPTPVTFLPLNPWALISGVLQKSAPSPIKCLAGR